MLERTPFVDAAVEDLEHPGILGVFGGHRLPVPHDQRVTVPVAHLLDHVREIMTIGDDVRTQDVGEIEIIKRRGSFEGETMVFKPPGGRGMRSGLTQKNVFM